MVEFHLADLPLPFPRQRATQIPIDLAVVEGELTPVLGSRRFLDLRQRRAKPAVRETGSSLDLSAHHVFPASPPWAGNAHPITNGRRGFRANFGRGGHQEKDRGRSAGSGMVLISFMVTCGRGMGGLGATGTAAFSRRRGRSWPRPRAGPIARPLPAAYLTTPPRHKIASFAGTIMCARIPL